MAKRLSLRRILNDENIPQHGDRLKSVPELMVVGRSAGYDASGSLYVRVQYMEVPLEEHKEKPE